MKNFTVTAPATSANIGAGFDCMGIALTLCNEIEVFETDRELEIITDPKFSAGKDNLVYQSMDKVFSLCGRRVNTGFKQINRIPAASGLGSSAACVVAGVTAANALLNFPLSEKDVIELCTALDSHPDNVVPCIVGGVTAGATDNGKVYYTGRVPDNRFTFAACTPPFGLKTEEMRKVLPDSYSRADVVFSLQRAVLTFSALTGGDKELLRVLDDKLHTPYRKPLIKGYNEIERQLKEAGALAVYLSGAGPTVTGIFYGEVKLPSSLTAHGCEYAVRLLKAREKGVEICCKD